MTQTEDSRRRSGFARCFAFDCRAKPDLPLLDFPSANAGVRNSGTGPIKTIKVLPKGLCPYYKAIVFADAALQIFTNFIPDNSGA